MDFEKERPEQSKKKLKCCHKRHSCTVVMVAVSFFLILILCAFSFSGLGLAKGGGRTAKAVESRVTFSTKTPYKFEAELSTNMQKPEGCSAIQLNMVFRHGTRYPSENDIIKVNKMINSLKSFGDNREFLEQLSKLNITLINPYPVELEKELASVGDRELYDIGKRYQKRFPELVTGKFRVNEFRFTSTCKARSCQSANAFALGFLEGHGTIGKEKIQPVPLEIKPCGNDSILRYFDLCEKYQKDVEDNKTAMNEMETFLQGNEVDEIVKKVKEQLKLGNEANLTSKEVKMMYLMCAFGVAIFNNGLDDGWCSLFDNEDFDVMEYVLDLKSYYKRSSAYKITYESSCPLLRAILESLEAKAGNTTKSKKYLGIFRSSHAETLIPLYALMGLMVDKRPLLAANYKEMKNREFRGSRIAPFAGNLAIVLYECANNTNKVQLYSNEKLIKFPCCKSEVDCPFDLFQGCYQKISTDCNLKSMCKVNSTRSRDEL